MTTRLCRCGRPAMPARTRCGACNMADWRAANPERSRAARRAYYATNADKVKARHAELMRDKTALKQTKRQARRARELAAPGNGVTGAEWTAILVAAGHRCTYCGRDDVALEMDHVVPLARGGAHDPTNVTPACRTCNAKKGTS